ncbi:hypothetical protein [Cupriavidus sp. AcVe19-1a]|uniref:hypothetical protein n=1 Tax=Cupriavidus sp. AcVe19-1a TaxID=2821359 RepID=UPI001AE42F38|nr:hypothetical protein [Cupriavidus sp. AcVe19-1a]
MEHATVRHIFRRTTVEADHERSGRNAPQVRCFALKSYGRMDDERGRTNLNPRQQRQLPSEAKIKMRLIAKLVDRQPS